MRLHKISYEKDGQQRQEFATSEGDASKRCTALKADKDVFDKPTREPVEVPTDKAGLLDWLNKNATFAGAA